MKAYITLPNGKPCSIGVYVRAWRRLKAAPPLQDIKGWDWFPTHACSVLADISRGCRDRINRHDRTQFEYPSNPRLFKKIKAAGARGALVYRCRSCGTALDFRSVNPNNAQTRRCPECRS